MIAFTSCFVFICKFVLRYNEPGNFYETKTVFLAHLKEADLMMKRPCKKGSETKRVILVSYLDDKHLNTRKRGTLIMTTICVQNI